MIKWNGIIYIKHMVSMCLMLFHVLYSSHDYEPSSPQQPPVCHMQGWSDVLFRTSFLYRVALLSLLRFSAFTCLAVAWCVSSPHTPAVKPVWYKVNQSPEPITVYKDSIMRQGPFFQKKWTSFSSLFYIPNWRQSRVKIHRSFQWWIKQP
jgi:hypothetical protein